MKSRYTHTRKDILYVSRSEDNKVVTVDSYVDRRTLARLDIPCEPGMRLRSYYLHGVLSARTYIHAAIEKHFGIWEIDQR